MKYLQLKINDMVSYTIGGTTYKIYADKETPYKHFGGDIFPDEDGDFVICKFPLEKDKFAPFISVSEKTLVPHFWLYNPN